MPRIPGFVGPTYTHRSVNAAIEEAINFYVEVIESPNAAHRAALMDAPGLELFTTLPTSPIRGLWANDITEDFSRVFAAAGDTFYELFDDGSFAALPGAIANPSPTTPVEFFPNTTGNEILLISGDIAYRADGASVLPITDTEGDPLELRSGGYLDSYFMGAIPASKDFRISELLDASIWDPLDKGTKEGYSDHIERMLVDGKTVILFGSETTEGWYDSGDADFPFQPIPGAFIDQGIAARWSAARIDNTVVWLGSDSRGQGIVWRLQGWTPVRISTHALENAMRSYSTINDAQAWTYTEGGHAFYVLNFPTADATWVYDFSTGLWHKRGYWDIPNHIYHRHRGACHTFGFKKHLVGDYATGKIYEMNQSFKSDAGNPLRRLRRAPHLNGELKYIFYSRFQLDMETGVGLNVDLDPTLQGQNPQAMLRWSNDGGHTWSNEHWVSIGKIGEFNARAIWSRLGRARNRVYEVVFTDPVPITITEAYYEAQVGTS